jgi:nucleoside-diphosphate-sugar epimerase
MHETVLTYGMPRKALWVQCWSYKIKHGFNSIHIVLPNLYGPGDHFDPIRSHALGALIKKTVDAKLSGDSTVDAWGTGRPVREWGYVEDAAEGIVIAMEKYNDIRILNLGEGKGYTIKETAEMIKEAVGWDGEYAFDTSRLDGAPTKVLDVRRMKEALGWQPKTPIREGIRKTVKWYMKNMVQSRGGKT